MLSSSSIVVLSQEQVSSNISEKTVVLNLKSGIYYSLNSVGIAVWNLIQEPKTVREIQDSLLKEYQVDSEQCSREIFVLLQDLESVGLIEIKNAGDKRQT